MKTNFEIKNVTFAILASLAILLMQGCASTYMPINQQRDPSVDARVQEWTAANRQVTRGANETAPDFNNIDVCPPGTSKTGHTAGGGGDSSVHKSEKGTKYDVNVDFGWSVKDCK